ncbi:MAG: LemA family protein [Eubacteriales bacterium]|nr:LemA family protein [Eubacteriales bacterium]
MVYIIVGAVLFLLIIWIIASYNGFVRLKNSIEEAFSTMDVYLKKRYDLIPNLVETVKGYASHEKETLERVMAARNMAASAKTMDERVEGENMLAGTLKTLFAVAEAYPDLKANTSFLELQGELRRIEDEIANSRKYYNAVVKTYNTKREVFPSVIIAGLFRFEKKPLFEVSAEEQRENVKVQF